MSHAERSRMTVQDLSSKQRQVLDLIMDRRTNKEIATALGISPSAVEQRLQSVRRKLGCHSRADLARTYQLLLHTCASHTGAKLQVEDGSAEVQKSPQVLDSYGIGVIQDEPSWGGQAARNMEPDGQSDGQGKLLNRIDEHAGIAGRLAAVALIATSLALLLKIITSAY